MARLCALLALCFQFNAYSRGLDDAELDLLLRTQPVVEVVHYGTAVSESVKEVLFRLRARGFTVRGSLVDKAGFEEALALGDGIELEQVEDEKPMGLTGVLQRCLGLQGGCTTLDFPFRPSEALKAVRTRALVVANTLMAVVLYARGEGNDHGVPNLVLSAWVYTHLSNADSIYRFKSQGAVLRLDAAAPQGEQIQVDVHRGFLAVAMFFEELIINFTLRATLTGVVPAASDPVGLVVGSVFGAFAKTTTDFVVARQLRRADAARKRGEAGAAKQIEDHAAALQDRYYTYLFPVLKFLQIPPGNSLLEVVAHSLGNVGFALVGIAGLVQEAMAGGFTPAPAQEESDDCRTLLRFHAL